MITAGITFSLYVFQEPFVAFFYALVPLVAVVTIGWPAGLLAEAAIAQQLDIEAQIPVLEATIADSGSKEKELEGYITALQAKKREMQDELRLYRESVIESETVAAGGTQTATATGSNVAAKVDEGGQ